MASIVRFTIFACAGASCAQSPHSEYMIHISCGAKFLYESTHTRQTQSSFSFLYFFFMHLVSASSFFLFFLVGGFLSQESSFKLSSNIFSYQLVLSEVVLWEAVLSFRVLWLAIQLQKWWTQVMGCDWTTEVVATQAGSGDSTRDVVGTVDGSGDWTTAFVRSVV